MHPHIDAEECSANKSDEPLMNNCISSKDSHTLGEHSFCVPEPSSERNVPDTNCNDSLSLTSPPVLIGQDSMCSDPSSCECTATVPVHTTVLARVDEVGRILEDSNRDEVSLVHSATMSSDGDSDGDIDVGASGALDKNRNDDHDRQNNDVYCLENNNAKSCSDSIIKIGGINNDNNSANKFDDTFISINNNESDANRGTRELNTIVSNENTTTNQIVTNIPCVNTVIPDTNSIGSMSANNVHSDLLNGTNNNSAIMNHLYNINYNNMRGSTEIKRSLDNQIMKAKWTKHKEAYLDKITNALPNSRVPFIRHKYALAIFNRYYVRASASGTVEQREMYTGECRT